LVVVAWVHAEVLAEAGHAAVAEDAEDVALVVVELRRGFAAEDGEFFMQEGLDACEREVGETWAVVEEGSHSLSMNVSSTI
jgi:hypothetical protein